jgi:cysteine-rich repeat protein
MYQKRFIWAILAIYILQWAPVATSGLSRAGGAGHALLFRDNGLLIEDFNDLGESELTFEAWVRTSDSCHNTALFSYAAKPEHPERGSTDLEANHFVVFNQNKLVACHDFEYMELLPDPMGESCYFAYNHSSFLPNVVTRDGSWHHVAVTWTAANNGLTEIFVDGLRIISTKTRKTAPLKKGGALMLGAEQDCYGGCLDKGQGFNGEMDEVRIWKVARSQEDILKHMRDSEGLDSHPDLAAYWKMNDPIDSGAGTRVVKDSSGRGNDLVLATMPKSSIQNIASKMFSQSLNGVGVASFKNNFAMNQNFRGMPKGDISIEFWARTPAYGIDPPDTYADFISFATFSGDKSASSGDYLSLDEGILIQKYSNEFAGTKDIDFKDIRTSGSISISINSNRNGMGSGHENWIDYNVGWVDGEWHHIAVTWSELTGTVHLYFDGTKAKPYWVCNNGNVELEKRSGEGVSEIIAKGISRSDTGSFVLGARQQSYGGNFSPQYSLKGDMAQLRIWEKALSQEEIEGNMFKGLLGPSTPGLFQEYSFSPDSFHDDKASLTGYIEDKFDDKHSNHLYFGSDSPLWVYSTAPLAHGDGSPMAPPSPGDSGHALRLDDMQVLIHRKFDNFPTTAFTVEFWMISSDTCNAGVPFSYATGGYDDGDNALMIGDYNNWVISVMQDEGTSSSQFSGVASADGKWHHIAVTWESSTGETRLFDNGKEVWRVTRAKGKQIPSGGSLIVGREQDCVGGCFDSASGAVGDISDSSAQEYGAQDFFGLIDELRIWKRVRTADEIRGAMKSHLKNKGITGDSDKGQSIDPKDRDLVAYYNFDEGSGYMVRDLTGNGHDLIVTQKPSWEVAEYFSVCGNGVLEGLEECDNGDTSSGKGCSKSCTVMDGWECTSTSPSTCWKKDSSPGDAGKHDRDSKGDEDKGHSDTAPSKDEKGSIANVVAPIVSILLFAGVGAAVYTQRRIIFDRYPDVEDWISRMKQSVIGVRYTLIPNRGLDMEHVDTAESPDFTAAMPPPGRGNYSAF